MTNTKVCNHYKFVLSCCQVQVNKKGILFLKNGISFEVFSMLIVKYDVLNTRILTYHIFPILL